MAKKVISEDDLKDSKQIKKEVKEQIKLCKSSKGNENTIDNELKGFVADLHVGEQNDTAMQRLLKTLDKDNVDESDQKLEDLDNLDYIEKLEVIVDCYFELDRVLSERYKTEKFLMKNNTDSRFMLITFMEDIVNLLNEHEIDFFNREVVAYISYTQEYKPIWDILRALNYIPY